MEKWRVSTEDDSDISDYKSDGNGLCQKYIYKLTLPLPTSTW